MLPWNTGAVNGCGVAAHRRAGAELLLRRRQRHTGDVLGVRSGATLGESIVASTMDLERGMGRCGVRREGERRGSNGGRQPPDQVDDL